MNKEKLNVYQGIEVPVSPVLVPIRESGYGHVEGLSDEELLTAGELERWVYLQEFGPILALPRPKQDCFFRPNGFDDNGTPDWGAFGTVAFERYSGGFNKRLYKADKLKERLKDKSIVFEIVSGDSERLRWAIPAVQQYIRQLRQRFPELPIAVVSHGKEQFSLTRDKQKKYNKVHKGIQSLVKDSNVPVHVCGTYADWHNVDESEFPDYVDVAAAGPVQINDYRQLGYLLVKVK